MVDDINLEQKNKKYDPKEVIFNLDDSDASDCSNIEETFMQLPAETPIQVRPTVIL